jgi:hypothetical protein
MPELPVVSYSRPLGPVIVVSRRVDVFEHQTLKVGLWHGGRKVDDRFGYTCFSDGPHPGLLRELREFVAGFAITADSSLKVRVEHLVERRHVDADPASDARRSTGMDEIHRVRHVAALFEDLPETSVLAVPFDSRFTVLDSAIPSVPVESLYAGWAEVNLPDWLSWAGWGWEGFDGRPSVRLDVCASGPGTLVVEGVAHVCVPAGPLPGADARLFERCADAGPRPFPDTNGLKLKTERHPLPATRFRFDEAVAVDSRYAAFDAKVRQAFTEGFSP